jgi:hypothetical protein
MPKKRYTSEEIVAKLRQVDVLLGQGETVGEGVNECRHRSAGRFVVPVARSRVYGTCARRSDAERSKLRQLRVPATKIMALSQ